MTVSALALGVALLRLAPSAVDRAREQPRTIAKQVCFRVPGRVLRASQLQETLLPLFVALTLAIALGGLLVLAYVSGWPPLGRVHRSRNARRRRLRRGPARRPHVAPVIRTRITPDTLRRE